MGRCLISTSQIRFADSRSSHLRTSHPFRRPVEITADAKKAASGGALVAIAGVFAFLALILLLISAAYGLVAAGVALMVLARLVGRRRN